MANIMIVDDSLVMRKILRTYFSQIGHTVVAEANGGEQALLYYDAYKPDLVTLDITMPGDDGTIILKQLIKKTPTLKIIIVSAVTKKTTIMDALTSGAKYYILKPFTFDKIVSAVRGVFGDVKKEEVIKRAEEEVDIAIEEEKNDSVLNVVEESIIADKPFSHSVKIEAAENITQKHFEAYKKMIAEIISTQPNVVEIDLGKNKDMVAELKKITAEMFVNKSIDYSILEP